MASSFVSVVSTLVLGSGTAFAVWTQDPATASDHPALIINASIDERLEYNIPAQPLRQALLLYGEYTGLQISADPATITGINAPALEGKYTPQEALKKLLSGTNLSLQYIGKTSVVVSRPNRVYAQAGDGTPLDTIIVDQGSDSENGDDYTPFDTPGAVEHISEETIQRFRGGSPADMLLGTPGVMSGEARNAGSSLDVNIRGMQGMGRVAVTIDGAMNTANIYQGYQGISNRSFLDPDFLAGIDITKGSDAASNGIAGTVSMRTINAGDIVKEGKTFGVRIKGELGNNTSHSPAGTKAGYKITNKYNKFPLLESSQETMNRPGFFKAAQGSASIVGAMKTKKVDLMIGYAQRKQGNYHAGKNGKAAKTNSLGLTEYCSRSKCYPLNERAYYDFLELEGLSNYRKGEEVLNTSLETRSFLAKGTVRFGDHQALQLGYMWFDSEAGDKLASRFATDATQAEQEEQTVGAKVDTFTLKYRWQPTENDLINLKANLWHTSLELRNPRRAGSVWSLVQPEDFGLPDDFRVGKDNEMWGGDVTNITKLQAGSLPLTLTYGLSYLSEDTKPSAYTNELEDWLKVRDGHRDEAAAFTKAKLEVTDWLTINGGLRYQHFWSEDRSINKAGGDFNASESRKQKLSVGDWNPNIGVTLEPYDGMQFYVNYSSAARAPSIMEALTGFSTRFNPDLESERSSNWELGINLKSDSVLFDKDRAMIKFGYFNWNVDNYLARQWKTDFIQPGSSYAVKSMYVYNIDKAKFEGLEFSGRYEVNGFTAQLAANYYTDVTFCKTADTCSQVSLYADYATNQIPPEYMIDLTLSQKFFNDSLEVGGRIHHVGARAIEHGEVTATGASNFISVIEWEPYTLLDVFAKYKINDNLTANLRVQNLTDEYYIDPLGLVLQPGPGRTFYASMTAGF